MAEKGKAESIAALFIYNDDDEMDEEDEKVEYRETDAAQRDTFPFVTDVARDRSLEEERNGDAGVLGMFNYGQEEGAATPEREESDEEQRSGLLPPEGTEREKGLAREKSRTPPGAVVILTPKNNAATPSILSPLADDRSGERAASQEAPAAVRQEKEEARDAMPGEDNGNTNEGQEKDPMEIDDDDESRGVLDTFLPPPPTEKCSEELQAKFARYLHIKQVQGRNINDAIRMTKGYKNPDFMQQAVEHQGIDEIGSCFAKEIFDPRGVDRSDYYDQVALDQRRVNERKEQERKQKGQIEFQRGNVQLPPGPPKPVVQLISGQRGLFSSMPIGMGVGMAGLPQMLGSAVAVGAAAAIVDADSKKDGRDRKRSKWDKVGEGDSGRAPGSKSAQDVLAAAKAHAATIGGGTNAVSGSRPPTVQSKGRDSEGDGKGRIREKSGKQNAKV